MGMDFKQCSLLALNEMEKSVKKYGRAGVGAILYAEKENDMEWLSAFRIIGDSKVILEDGTGYNFISLAYSKASESIETGKNSGALERPLIEGEFGYEGSAIAEYQGNVIITSFSGITGDVDYKIAKAALDLLMSSLQD